MKEEHKEFLEEVQKLREYGKTEKEISEAFGFMSTAELRRTINEYHREEHDEIVKEVNRLIEEGRSKSEIAKLLNISESSVMNLAK